MVSVLDPALPIRVQMEKLVKQKQLEITSALESLDSASFRADEWQRGESGGGGRSMVLQNGKTFEKGGVNVSVVHGVLPPQAIEKMKADHKNIRASAGGSVQFFACGLSLVIHPWNPHAPTTHLNYRYFEIMNEDGSPQTWWFGGGSDLTPSYIYDEDCVNFHQQHKTALDKFGPDLYPRFKKWCDEYFFIPHRNETRGIGGIFFDDFDELPPQQCLEMVESCFNAFLPAYLPLVERRKDTPYTEVQKEWQQIRRGRYVEFNLVYDRGTKFGLQTPGSRTESILMSLPLTAKWIYDHQAPGPEEQRLLEVVQKPVEWLESS
ncbi:hypothetical protein KL930_000103 [Ogataea haglerorum]|uniref:coproporphyrinogen oxidase n=1 Tax=Ogataea haglerorum TaxID=1937702 RepID=A0ABQ7RE30_9ASCO|nr:uncharacterized protein KL911_001030 [Ogataea haglerorum]KAG7697842.1 hypothetical protein KL951_002416 [Ogataea haglerorum]KAG7709402.1 hypothetical protein KL914_001792 [Ogataea haglerorum]KAG7741982.1 hypothetical protein KL923_001237 [Ogataea haglerorum]KAG7742184.1 hypothetical protein KL932_002326 [Ogataea haglerorum]KAG7750621.1 hypothetical protein KL912_001181 [Ogataea haglerorum]